MLRMFNWRQTSAALHRSVHTASTAWAFSIALWFWLSGCLVLVVLLGLVIGFGLGLFLVEVIDEFFYRCSTAAVFILGIGQFEFEFAFLGAQDDRLALHAADHVEGSAGLAAQGHLQQVFFDARFDGLAQLGLDLKEAIGWAEAADALMRTLVVVILDPGTNALPRRVEAFELGAGEELLPEAGPEALDLAQRHRVLRTGFEVRDTILLQLRLEARGAAPRSVLAAIVGEHLPGRLELGDGLAIDLDDRLGRRAAEEISADEEARIIIEEGDDVSVAPAQAKGEDVRLPHLIGRGPLEEAGPREVALFGRGLLRHEAGVVQLGAHRLRAGLEEENPAQPLRDAFDAKGRVLLFEFEDFGGNGAGQFGLAQVGRGVSLEAFHSELLILLDPA